MHIHPSGSCINGRFEVELGPLEDHSLEGGMGVVYICMDRRHGRHRALKTMRPELSSDRSGLARLYRVRAVPRL